MSEITPNLEEMLETHLETELMALEFCPAGEFPRIFRKSCNLGKIPRFLTRPFPARFASIYTQTGLSNDPAQFRIPVLYIYP